MSLKKRKADGHVELPDNWVAVPSKSHANKIYYYNKVTKKRTWENPFKNTQKDKKSVINHQVRQSSASSRKKKPIDDNESEPGECTSKTTPHTCKFPETKSNDAHSKRDKIEARRRTKNTRSGVTSTDSIRFSISEAALQKTKNASSEEKRNLRSGTDRTCVSREIKQIPTSPERNEVKSYRETQPKRKNLAQERLKSKRKMFEIEAIKKLSSMGWDKSNLMMDLVKRERIEDSVERRYTSSSSTSCSVPATTRGRERIRKQLMGFKENTADVSNDGSCNLLKHDSSMDLDEEMDWEPSEQEVMIEHIKTMRRTRDNVEELSNIAVCSNTDVEANNNLILVFDTNVFISCLPFIKEIRDTSVSGFGLPRIFIPWRVLQELDHLKSSDIRPLQVSAVRAIRFINENFSSRHPRVTGQSYEEFNSIVGGSGSSPDDEILQMCLNLKQKDRSRMVVLITNDKNLESKAIISGVEAFSKDRFMKDKLGEANKKASTVKGDAKLRNITLKNDMAYCRLKGALKKFLQQLLETEFMNAFNEQWKKIVTKKPPWMLMDMFHCLIKHWRSVFTFIFKKDVLALVEDLKEHFVKVENGDDVTVTDIAHVSKELLTRMRHFVGTEKPYSKILGETIKEVEMWDNSKSPSNADKAEESERSRSPTPAPSASHEPVTIYNAQSPVYDAALSRDKVKNLFQIIWDQVKAFVCRISELAASNGMNNPDAVVEVKNQFPHVIGKVQELVEIVEKILSLGPEDASQANQIILHFINFLLGLNVVQMDAAEINNLPGYIGLCCGDNDGRIVLYTFVNDLKQFAMGMIDGMKVLERL